MLSVGGTEPPLVFLSSFDASCLEFRMLIPLLEAAGTEAWAVDVVGWGFTEAGIQPGSKEVLGAAERRAHLLAFWQQKVSHAQLLQLHLNEICGQSVAYVLAGHNRADFFWHQGTVCCALMQLLQA